MERVACEHFQNDWPGKISPPVYPRVAFKHIPWVRYYRLTVQRLNRSQGWMGRTRNLRQKPLQQFFSSSTNSTHQGRLSSILGLGYSSAQLSRQGHSPAGIHHGRYLSRLAEVAFHLGNYHHSGRGTQQPSSPKLFGISDGIPRLLAISATEKRRRWPLPPHFCASLHLWSLLGGARHAADSLLRKAAARVGPRRASRRAGDGIMLDFPRQR
jgi:hypothetical protein